MLDINLIRDNPEKVKDALAKKNFPSKTIDKLLSFDTEWRSKISALDQLKSEQNQVSRELGKKQTEDLLSRAQILKKRIIQIGAEKEKIQSQRDVLLKDLPNLPASDVPVGKDETFNQVVSEVGQKTEFKFKPRNYLEIAEVLNLIDVKKASEVVGSRFGYLLNEAVMLEFALVKLAFDTLLPEGFIPVVPPVMIRPKVFEGMGRISLNQKEERYFLSKDDLYLIGSAEHTLGPIHMNNVLKEEDLPKRYVGFSTCFRREAGSYGKDTKGILRVHQFDKIELFSFARPEDSEVEHEFLLSMQEKLMQALKIPYRVVLISTGDMGFTDYKQYDIESWLPGQNEYRETHSCSNTTDFQARGINVKYRLKNGETDYVHMLNATGFAVGRTIIAILENYQTKNGTVKIPAVLKNFVGKSEIS